MHRRYFTSQGSKLAYLPIEKCASEWGERYFKKCFGFEIQKDRNFSNLEEWKDLEFIVFIRNPIRRWISGISEYVLARYGYDYELSDKEVTLLFQGVVFDIHTMPICHFVEGIDIEKLHFFHLDSESFDKKLKDFVYSRLGYTECFPEKYNVTAEDPYKYKISKLLKHKLMEDITLYQHIAYRYYEDWEFFSNIPDIELKNELDQYSHEILKTT